MNQLGTIAPITDTEAADSVSAPALADLAQRILATDRPPAGATARGRTPTRHPRRARQRWLVGAGAAALAGAAAAAAVTLGPSAHVGPVSVGAGTAKAALSFTPDAGYLDVIVRDPLADPARYRAEFAAHHLNVAMTLVPASPSLVGTLVYFDGSDAIKPITAVGRCFTGGGGNVCPVGIRIPLDYRGHLDVTFGRAARPGEQYETSADATAPGEALHGLAIDGQTVATVLAALRARHVSAAQWRSVSTSQSTPLTAGQVPGSWYVHGAVPWAPGEVLLFVGPTPAVAAAPPAPGTPTPTPTGSTSTSTSS